MQLLTCVPHSSNPISSDIQNIPMTYHRLSSLCFNVALWKDATLITTVLYLKFCEFCSLHPVSKWYSFCKCTLHSQSAAYTLQLFLNMGEGCATHCIQCPLIFVKRTPLHISMGHRRAFWNRASSRNGSALYQRKLLQSCESYIL